MTEAVPLLLVEDEPHIAQGLIYNLQQEGYQVTHVTTGEEALSELEEKFFALLILDLMLPGIDGLEVCERVRGQDSELPILMLTARGEDQDRISGLSKGADDYLTKPFNLKEFLLRVQNLLRRRAWSSRRWSYKETVYRFGSNQINLETCEATTQQGTIQLTKLEMKVLQLFFDHEGKVLSRGELLRRAWHISPQAETRTLDNFIVRLRKYFEDNPSKPRFFRTVRGRGYRFVRHP